MDGDISSQVSVLLGVFVGAVLTFLSQYYLHRQQEKSEVRKKALDLKNSQLIALWDMFSKTYDCLFYSGIYSPDKIDWKGLGKHIKDLNVAIVRSQLFMSSQGFSRLLQVRDALNDYFLKQESGTFPSYEEYTAFISKLEGPMNVASEAVRKELRLADLDTFLP